MPAARAAGFTGSARNFRRLVADVKAAYRREQGPAVLAALRRAVAFRRWRACDVASILAAGNGVPSPRAAGEALVLGLPVAPTRSLEAYRIGGTR